MSSTYEPIASATAAGGNTSQLVMSSIPSTYTDLILIINGNQSIDDETRLRFNGDSGTNYSCTGMYGAGSGSGSPIRYTSTDYVQLGGIYTLSGVGTNIIQIMNYANTNIFKTVLNKANSGNYVQTRVNLWRSTSAINSITAFGSTTWTVGTTFTLYGIKAE